MTHRFSQIDYTKGILTIGMVFVHVTQFLNHDHNRLFKVASLFIGLVSFSGFLFCFGFASWLAYLQKPKIPWASVLKTSFKCYFAFLISGIAYRILVSDESVSWKLLIKVAALRDIPGYSEFIVSFSLVILLSCLIAPAIEFATRHKKNLLIATFGCLIFTLLPNSANYDPFLGLLIGGQGFAYFPIIQYMPLFLLGVYFARHRHSYNIQLAALSIMGVVVFAALILLKIPVSRFPPSAIWIICSAALVYIYYGIAHVITKNCPVLIKRYLNVVGQNVLTYLILSNITIFTSKALGIGGTLNTVQTLIFFMIIMAVIFFLQYISIDLHRSNQSIKQGT